MSHGFDFVFLLRDGDLVDFKAQGYLANGLLSMLKILLVSSLS